MPSAAFPFIEVHIDTSGLTPVAQRAPGVIAIVGLTAAGADGGAAAINTPTVISTLDDAASSFAKVTGGVVAETPLYTSLKLAMLQDPQPSKIYGVRVDSAAGDHYAAALSSLEAIDEITFVCLANEKNVGAATAGATPASGLMALKEHVENMSAQGHKRIGVAMVDPAVDKSPTYVDTITSAVASLKSDVSRMVLVAARGSTDDVASAAMAAIAGYEPQISLVLKRVNGITMPQAKQYGPSEIIGLSEAGINPIIVPSLIPGGAHTFADGRCFSTNPDLPYIDIVRVLDDIDFRLKAGLIGMVGDARITKTGLTLVKTQVESILGPLKQRNVIADFAVSIAVLDVLSVPESAWSATDRANVVTARANRTVEMLVSVTYGPAVHRLKVTLAPKF